MHYIDTPAPSPPLTLILVHGSWHNGSSWAAVQEQLAAVGVRSIAPTLPGHGAGDDRLAISHDDYVCAVIAELDAVRAPVVLVGHSFGGSVISRVAELRSEDCHGLVYYSAFVPRDGERVADSLPPQFIEFLDQAAAASADGAIELPDQALRQAFANTADEDTLARIRRLLVPEPYAPVFEALALPGFARLRIPAVYITCRDDRTMPPGTFHPGQSSRLREPELIEIEGDHETLLTAPERLADALLEALDAIDAARRGRRERAPVARTASGHQ
jgi:pimeloyl-ACP methyl ester carboxylesterase